MWNRRDSKVPVELGLGALLQRFAREAAIPAVSIHESSLCRRLEINAPGADASNTEVRWDEGAQRLLVGVWCGRRPNWQQPLKFPGPELSWFRSFYLPSHDGRQARAQVARGVITIEVPSTRSDPEQVRGEQHASNVIMLPRRGEAASHQDSSGPGADASSRPSRVGAACRRLGTALCLALCLPVLLFSLFLFGFLLVPLLPLIAASFAWAMGRDEVPPPVRPNLPSTARPAPELDSLEHAEAA